MDSAVTGRLGLVILGSTGSIGRQTLEVVRSLSDRFKIVGLAAGGNATLLEEQAKEFRPRLLCCERESDYLRARVKARWCGMEEMAAHPDADLVVVATVGTAGLAPTLAALRAGKAVAIANKEVLVIAGELLTEEAKRHGGSLRPIDSEHSAVWQCLWGESPESVERIILTASGGPFRDTPLAELAQVTAEQALRHPNWQMGQKVTVDSATLLNKGLECIEARWLFDVPLDKIEVLLHRESIVHSLVEFRDGSVKAQLGAPDMRLPIQCALTYPERVPGATVTRLDLARIGMLSFGSPEMQRYPCLSLALEAGIKGGTFPAVLCAADEVAIQHFLAGHLRFTEIPRVIEGALVAHRGTSKPGLEDILAADASAREWAEDRVKAKA